MPESKRLKAEIDGAEEIKKHMQRVGFVPTTKIPVCRDKSCTNPICAAAEEVQREMPFLDDAAARKLARIRFLFEDCKHTAQVMHSPWCTAFGVLSVVLPIALPPGSAHVLTRMLSCL